MQRCRARPQRAWSLVVLLCGAAGCPAPTAAPTPSAREREVAFAEARDAREALGVAEAAKCLRIREALLRAGAQPHALPARREVALPTLRADEALLSFFALRGAYHRWVLRRSPGGAPQVTALAALPAPRIDPLLARARDALELGSLDALAELWPLLRRAERELFADAEPRLRGVRRLVVSPDGLLRYLPLHVLLAADAARETEPGRFVAQAREVSYLPCLGLLRPAARLPPRVELFAPRYGREPAPLTGALEEAARVGAALRVTLHDAGRGDDDAFAHALQRSEAIVHFAGHGLAAIDDTSSAGSRVPELVFGDAGRTVGVARATRRPLRAPLVVLASCSAAYAARFRDGQRLLAPTNLVEALLAAGVGTVVAASWAVKDAESAASLAAFYERLPGSSPGAALTHAYRKRMARIRPPHPRFWGAYAIYGAWR